MFVVQLLFLLILIRLIPGTIIFYIIYKDALHNPVDFYQVVSPCFWMTISSTLRNKFHILMKLCSSTLYHVLLTDRARALCCVTLWRWYFLGFDYMVIHAPMLIIFVCGDCWNLWRAQILYLFVRYSLYSNMASFVPYPHELSTTR